MAIRALQVTDFDTDVVAARNAWAQLVGVSPSEVATGASVSQLVGLVAASVPDGTKVLTLHNEFTSVTFPFAAQQHRGITVTETTPVSLFSQLREYDLVAISAVQSANGTVIDLLELKATAKAAGTQVLIDVSQAAGWEPLELHWADFVVGAAYKGCWHRVAPPGWQYVVMCSPTWFRRLRIGLGQKISGLAFMASRFA